MTDYVPVSWMQLLVANPYSFDILVLILIEFLRTG